MTQINDKTLTATIDSDDSFILQKNDGTHNRVNVGTIAPVASESVAGLAMFATVAEAQAREAANKILSPSLFDEGIKGGMAIYIPADATTAAIQSSIETAKTLGGIIRLAKDQVYNLSTLTVYSDVVLDGSGATIVLEAGVNGHAIVCTGGASNVRVYDLTIDANRANQAVGQASNIHNVFQLEYIDGLIMERVLVRNCADICFKLVGCTDVEMIGCKANGYGVEGWSVAGCVDVQLTRCIGENGDGVGGGGETGRGNPYAFEIEEENGTGTPGSERVTLTGCTAKNNTLGGGLNIRAHSGASSEVTDVKVLGYSSTGNLNAINTAGDIIRLDGLVSRGDVNFLNFSGGNDFALADFSATGLTGRGVVVAGTVANVSVSNGLLEAVDNCWRHNGGSIFSNMTFSNVSMVSTSEPAVYISGTGDVGMFGSKKITADHTTATFWVVSSADVDLVIDGPVIETTRGVDNTDVFYWDTVNGSLRFNSGKLRCTDGDYVTSLFRLRGAAADQDVELRLITFESDANNVIGVYATTSGTDEVVINNCRFTANVSRAIRGYGDNWTVTNNVFKGMTYAIRCYKIPATGWLITNNQFIDCTPFNGTIPGGIIDNNVGYP